MSSQGSFDKQSCSPTSEEDGMFINCYSPISPANSPSGLELSYPGLDTRPAICLSQLTDCNFGSQFEFSDHMKNVVYPSESVQYYIHIPQSSWQNEGNINKIDNDPSVKPRKIKRTRATFSSTQRLQLEEEFRKDSFLTRYRKIQLAQSLSLTEKQVKVWFQNRRMKDKRKHNEESNGHIFLSTKYNSSMECNRNSTENREIQYANMTDQRMQVDNIASENWYDDITPFHFAASPDGETFAYEEYLKIVTE